MNKTILLSLLALVVVGGVIGYSMIFKSEGQEPVTSNDNVEGSAAGLKVGPNAIYAAEQRPGSQLVINLVSIALPGYVVIHESKDGKSGSIIGSSALIEGSGEKNVKVTLQRAAKDGEELIAMLHEEKGGDGFDPAIDLPVLGTDGGAIHMMFQVSADAPDPSAAEIIM